ncbi:MAG TPA: DUF5777 family beta-barrel protein [Flavisolibacter sp.]
MCTKYLRPSLLILSVLLACTTAFAQHHDSATKHPEKIPVFEELLLIDDQTVFVPQKKSFEIELQQRFGTITNGMEDLLGIFAPSNTRIGIYYVPAKNLMVGAGITRKHLVLGLEAKYSLLKQGISPVAVSYFVNGSMDMEENEHVHESSERLSWFQQVMFAREFGKCFSLQVAPSLSHFNRIEQSIDETEVYDTSTVNHFAVSLLAQYRFSHAFSLVGEFDHPLTRHEVGGPLPNISLGVQFVKGAYCFQLFAENYYNIDAQSSNMFNRNDFSRGQFLIGFNLARTWNFSKKRAAGCH